MLNKRNFVQANRAKLIQGYMICKVLFMLHGWGLAAESERNFLAQGDFSEADAHQHHQGLKQLSKIEGQSSHCVILLPMRHMCHTLAALAVITVHWHKFKCKFCLIHNELSGSITTVPCTVKSWPPRPRGPWQDPDVNLWKNSGRSGGAPWLTTILIQGLEGGSGRDEEGELGHAEWMLEWTPMWGHKNC